MALPAISGGGFRLGAAPVGEALLIPQGAEAVYTGAAAPLLVADVTGGIITYNNAGANNLQLPTVANLELTLVNASNTPNLAFDFSLIAIGAGTGTITTNTGWTLVGSMAVATAISGRFRARKTGAGAWTLYRLS